MKTTLVMKLEKIPDPENVEIIHATQLKAFNYISSLQSALQWKIRKISGKIEFSRSGLSAFVDNIYVLAETNNHVHELYVYEVYGIYRNYSIPLAVANWFMDGEEMGIIILPKWVMERIRSMIDVLINTGAVSEGEFDVEIDRTRVLAPGDWF